jgi:hypothetical protein
MPHLDVAPAHRLEDQLVFFDQVLAGFTRAAERCGSVSRAFQVGPHTVRLHFAGSALVDRLHAAFAHLRATQGDAVADLTICVWDSASTGTELPLLLDVLVTHISRHRWEMLDAQHVVKGYDGHRIRTVFHFGPHILSVMDRERKLALYWLRDESALPSYECGYPFSRIINWWLEDEPVQVVHAAAVGNDRGAVLIPGISGSGKSTTALACYYHGMGLISDDTCLLYPGSPPRVHSLYSTAKLVGATDLARFPKFGGIVANGRRTGGEKALVYLNQYAASRLQVSAPLRAIFLPEITGEPRTRMEATGKQGVLMTLFHSTATILPHVHQATFEFLAQIVRDLPCYRLKLGTDMEDVAAVIVAQLDELI